MIDSTDTELEALIAAEEALEQEAEANSDLGTFVVRSPDGDESWPLNILIEGGLPPLPPGFVGPVHPVPVRRDDKGRRVIVLTGGLPDWLHTAENRAKARAEFEQQQREEQDAQQLADAFAVPENIVSPTALPNVDSAGKED